MPFCAELYSSVAYASPLSIIVAVVFVKRWKAHRKWYKFGLRKIKMSQRSLGTETPPHSHAVWPFPFGLALPTKLTHSWWNNTTTKGHSTTQSMSPLIISLFTLFASTCGILFFHRKIHLKALLPSPPYQPTNLAMVVLQSPGEYRTICTKMWLIF